VVTGLLAMLLLAVAVVGLVLLAVVLWRDELRYDRRPPPHG
jgi:hypothetical protein